MRTLPPLPPTMTSAAMPDAAECAADPIVADRLIRCDGWGAVGLQAVKSSATGARRSNDRVPCIKTRSEEHTSELQSQSNLVCRLLLEKKKHLKQALLTALHSRKLSMPVWLPHGLIVR